MRAEVVPGVLILLPACAGGVARAVEMYASLAGAELPDALSLAAGLGVTTVIVGISKVGGGLVDGARGGCFAWRGGGGGGGSPAPSPLPCPSAASPHTPCATQHLG